MTESGFPEPLSLIVGAFCVFFVWFVPFVIRTLIKRRKLAGRVLVVVDDPKNGTVGLVLVKTGDGTYVTQHQALVRFHEGKTRRVTGDITNYYRGLTAYLADAHSGELLDRVGNPDIEKTNKEAASFMASKAVKELGSDPEQDIRPLVKAAVILGVCTLVLLAVVAIGYFATKGGSS